MNISQEQLARELHVSFATVNRWENGKNSPNMLAMKELNDLCKEKGLEEALIKKLLD
jgi:putative transcriptional regulator